MALGVKEKLLWCGIQNHAFKLIFMCGIAHLLKFNFNGNYKVNLFQRSLIVLIS